MRLERVFGCAGAIAFVAWSSRAEAACDGAGQTWNCAAGSSADEVQTAVDGAADGATITFAAGSYAWSDTVSLSNDRGVTLACAKAGDCKLTVGARTVIWLNGTLAGANTHLYRVSGFAFEAARAGVFAIWFWGPGTLKQVRIDNNTFRNFEDSAIAVAFGESATGSAPTRA